MAKIADFWLLLCYPLHQLLLLSMPLQGMPKLSKNSPDDCDFDDDAAPTCHWRNIGKQLYFIRHSGPTTSHSTGPPGDHSKNQNGSYIYLEASNTKYGYTARIASKTFKPTIGRTLKFYTYMYGSTVNYLKVIVNKKTGETQELWKMSGNQGKMWMPVEIKYMSLVPYQIAIEAAAGRSFQSDIAIDDISFIDDPGPTFGWSQWNSWTTCKRVKNWCKKERFRVCLEKDPTFCGISDGGRIQKEVASCSLSTCRVDGHWSLWGPWSVCLSKCAAGQRTRTRLCNEPAPMHGGSDCKGDRKKTKPCWNGFCDRGPDDCDFDDDADPFCHWRNVNGTLGFHRKYLWTGTAGTGPQGDHSNNTNGKYIYLESSSPARYGQIAQLSSRLFKSKKDRTLKFYVYMYGRSVNYMRVLINTTNSSREIWRINGNHGKKWILAKVLYSCPLPHRITLEAAVGKDFQSDIAIDTIYFREGNRKSFYTKKLTSNLLRNNAYGLHRNLAVMFFSLLYVILLYK